MVRLTDVLPGGQPSGYMHARGKSKGGHYLELYACLLLADSSHASTIAWLAALADVPAVHL